MSTAIAVATQKEAESPLIREISLDKISPSKANPRRRTDEAALNELAENIKTHGVLQPILIRLVNSDCFEIVCGERRWRASKAAGKATIPARIVTLTDGEALELAVIENLQRENVHELDEALGYKALIKQNPELYTVETIAAKVGRSVSYVYQRLRLAELTPNIQAAFYAGKLTAGHAIEIARLQPKDQERAFQECFPGHRTTKAILRDKDPRPISVRELRDWIQREIHLSLANAPFDVNDPNLVPAAGPCSTCPKRSGSNPLLFADSIKRADICTDSGCFKQKRDGLVQIRVSELEAAGEKPAKVSDSYVYYGQKPAPGVLYRPDYNEATAGDCPSTTAAVVVEGKRAGTKLYICTDPKCKIHSARTVGLSPEEKAARKKQAQEQRIQQEYRKRLLTEVHKRVPGELGRHELDLIASSYFQQLGHDSQHRLSKFFSWDETKTKAVNGGYTDYLKLASAKLDKMAAAEIGKFLVVCALASELYFPTYYGNTSPKDTKLAREATYYKVNCDRVLREVKEKLSPKSQKAKPDSKLETTAKSNGKGKPK
jgi:ParB family chromosome partitioning protein